MPVSVAGICLRKSSLLLGKRMSGGSMGDRWEFPGGKVDQGETPGQALQREFLEELGLEIAVGSLIAVGSFTHHGVARRLEAYRITMPDPAAAELSSLPLCEHVQLRWIPCSQVGEYDLADSDRSILPQILQAVACRPQDSDVPSDS